MSAAYFLPIPGKQRTVVLRNPGSLRMSARAANRFKNHTLSTAPVNANANSLGQSACSALIMRAMIEERIHPTLGVTEIELI
jgi:hypothetical protein